MPENPDHGDAIALVTARDLAIGSNVTVTEPKSLDCSQRPALTVADGTAANQLAVFYATDSKIFRRKVIPDNDAQLGALRAPPGESMLLLPLAQAHDDVSCRAAIAAATGVMPPSGRCCVVNEWGNIIDVCNADSTLDSHPGGKLVVSDKAGPGDRFSGGVFLRQYAVRGKTSNTEMSTVWLPITDTAASPELASSR